MTVKLPIQKHPLDMAGRVFFNKEWYLALLGIVSQTNSVTTGGFTDEKGSAGSPGFAANVDFIPGTTDQLHLSQNYQSSANLFVTFDASWQGADSFMLSGNTLTFNAPIPEGVNKVYVKGFV